MMKKYTIFVCFAFISIALGGCSTVDGMGKDISKASQAVQQSM